MITLEWIQENQGSNVDAVGKSDERGVLTEGIEGPNAFRKPFLLAEGALIEPMVCETVHEDTVCSSSLWRHT